MTDKHRLGCEAAIRIWAADESDSVSCFQIRHCGKAKAVRLSTLEAICKALECQPGDILEYKTIGNDQT